MTLREINIYSGSGNEYWFWGGFQMRYFLLIITFLLIVSCSEPPTRNNPYDPHFDMPEPENVQIEHISLTEKKISWEFEIDNIEGFRISRRDSSDWIIVCEAACDLREYIDAAIPVNVNIQYKIVAFADINCSEDILLEYFDNTIPAPDSLAVMQANVHTYNLNWHDNANGEDGFIVERKIDDSGFIEIASLGENSIEYIDDISDRAGYEVVYYLIYCYVGEERSIAAEISNEILFPAPTNLLFEKLTVNRIRLSWEDNSFGEEGYVIDKCVDGEWQENYSAFSADAVEWIDEAADINCDLQYRIYGYAGGNVSDWAVSEVIDNTFPVINELTIEQLNVHCFRLDWQAEHIIGEAGFVIERAIDEGNYTEIAVLEPDIEEFVDDICQRDSIGVVSYRVKAFLGEDYSAYAEISSSMEFPAPDGLEYEKTALDQIRLSWIDSSNGEEGFRIDKQVNNVEWQENYGVVGENIVVWLDEAAEVNAELKYRLRAFAGVYESDLIETEVINNDLPEIINFEVEQINIHTYQLNWEQEHIIGEDGFLLSRSINGGEFVQISDLAADTEEFLDDICLRDSLDSIAYQICCYLGEEYSDNTTGEIEVEFSAPSDLEYEKLNVHRI